jgi:ligand-binding SRPBCC domain-containing protein
MRVHVLEREQVVPRGLDEVWAFFADAGNLEAITPPFLGFEVCTPQPIEMRVGTLIEYKLRLHGISLRWLTRIEEWEPGERFVDAQVRGPYGLWHHTHTFAAHPEGTFIRDRVRYRLPLGPLGALGLPLVRHDLRAIFDFRHAEVARRLAAPAGG